MEKKLIGRAEEVRLLERYYASDKSEMVAVYGRRRVGKTFLVRETMGDRIDYEYTGMYKTPARIQREQFQKEMGKRTGERMETPKDWFEAFDRLRDYLLSLQKPVVVVFLDELPWMDTQKGNFLPAFSQFWNGWGREKVLLKLYVCGSATTWMLDKLIGDKGGLYGRVSRPVYLAPFTLRETEQFLNDVKDMRYGRKSVLDIYMIFGGIPYYLDMLDRELPLSVNVDYLFFSANAPLRTEYDFLFRSLFKDSANYRKVIECLAVKMTGLTREEIAKASRLDGGELTRILSNLTACDFLRSYTEPNKKERSLLYQLVDMFSLFHLRFVWKNTGQDSRYWTHTGQKEEKNAWAGYAFEQVCLHHVPQIKTKLGIAGILCNTYAWSCKAFTDEDGAEWPGGQIDLILDRADNVMNLCEAKYSGDEFVISQSYAKNLSRRTELFRRKQNTKKDLRLTFLTLYGIKQNQNSAIVDHQILLDDLFT